LKSLDNLEQRLQNVHLKGPREERLLYVDLLNFCRFFFPERRDWNVTRAFRRVRDFVKAATKSHFKLKVFIDDAMPSEETERKWRSRRVKEILKGERNVPPCLSRMLGEMFIDCDVEAIYSDEKDSDTTIACFAHADRADILSNDKDLFRYTGSSYTVYEDFEIKSNKLFIFPKSRPSGRRPKPIPIGPKPEVNYSCKHIHNGIYRRGIVTPLHRALDIDVHSILIPLLRANFVRNGILGPIVETWPFWDSSKEDVAWHYEESLLYSHRRFSFSLTTPDSAFEFFFPDIEHHKPSFVKSALWKKHIFGLRCIVYDLCSTESSPMYRFWTNFEDKLRSARGPPINSHHSQNHKKV
jgi:hypothetical protein